MTAGAAGGKGADAFCVRSLETVKKTAMPFFDKRLAAYYAHELSAVGGQFAHFVV